MTNKEWAIANLTGKVLNRAMRAIKEQGKNSKAKPHTIMSLFSWIMTQEGHDYWGAVYYQIPNADQYLPPDYVEAPEYVGEVEAKTYTEAEVKQIFKQAQEIVFTADGVSFKYETFEQFKNSNQ